MRIIALTSHPVNILAPDAKIFTTNIKGRKMLIYQGIDLEVDVAVQIPASGLPIPQVTDLEPSLETIEINGHEIPLSRVVGKEIKDLPLPQENVVYITSSFTQAAAREIGRTDIYAPADLVCTVNDDGSTTIVGTRGLKY